MKKKRIFLLVILMILFGCTTNDKTGNATQHDSQQETQGTQQDTQQEVRRDGIVIALLDTGVSTAAIQSGHLLSGYNYVTNSTDTEDLINHGTAVTSVILGCESAEVEGAAQDAFVIPLVVVTKQDGKVTGISPELLAKAIRDSVDRYKADIINVSLGIHKDDTELLAAVQYAEEKGVLVVSAVGNGGADAKPYYPAAYDTVLAVGSCDAHGNRSEFTQDGADILAQGEGIRLASKNGKIYGDKGTSYAAAYVSANAANMLIKAPSLTPPELREKLIREANLKGN